MPSNFCEREGELGRLEAKTLSYRKRKKTFPSLKGRAGPRPCTVLERGRREKSGKRVKRKGGTKTWGYGKGTIDKKERKRKGPQAL